MNFQKMFKNFNFKTALKISGAVVFGFVVLSLLVSLGGFAFRTAFNISPNYYGNSKAPLSSNYGKGYSTSMEQTEMQLSARNVMLDIDDGYISGKDAEDFEITEYNARIKTSRLDKVCNEIKELKTKDYIIFERANKNENYCGYRFKVEKNRAEEVLRIIKNLKPENLDINTSSIKKRIEDFTGEEEILTKRLAQIEETLEDAQNAYNAVTQLATKARDVETLAKIINDKIVLIEKLTTERLNTKNNLDKLSQAKALQLDKLDYTFFTVSVYKNLIIDIKVIKDSWERELKNFVREFNNMLQGISIKLLLCATKLIQVAIYLLIALFVAKYGWRFVKFVWKK